MAEKVSRRNSDSGVATIKTENSKRSRKKQTCSSAKKQQQRSVQKGKEIKKNITKAKVKRTSQRNNMQQ